MQVEDINAIVGLRIKAYRDVIGKTQAQLAEITEINRVTISQLEAGKQQITVNLIYTLAHKLNVEITTFLPSVKLLELQSTSDSNLINEKLEQQNLDATTKNSILHLLGKKPENDK